LTRRFGVILLWLAAWLFPSGADAAVVRYAVIVGHNEGDVDEVRLRYAESDATKVFQVLHDLGSFRPENMVLLLGEDADSVQRVLIDINDRVRTATENGDEAVLFVYYSGHADSDALHLGGEQLETARVRRLVRGSSADMRILMIDACRSGALTRVKGGKQGEPFAIELDEQLTGEGLVFLTSSAANEDAQESDALKGSFFTHYFVSALAGAGDRDGNAEVSLEEAYAYAYENTLRATSRTLAGVQHPTFRYDLKGRGGFVLTRVGILHPGRAILRFPKGRTYLVFADDEDGPVVAEVGVRDVRRDINIEAGRYFIRGRARDHLLEGKLRVREGETHSVQDRELRRLEYARLARKGNHERELAHGPQVGYQLRTPMWRGANLCHGVRGGYAVDHRWLTVVPRIGWCRAGFDNDRIEATADELDLDLTLAHVFDVPVVSIGIGLVGGVTWLRQTFRTEGSAPPRNTIGGHVDIVLTLQWDLPRGFYLETDLAGQVHLFPQSTDGRESSTTAAVVTARPFFGVGKRF
jgi:hypothetical protein